VLKEVRAECQALSDVTKQLSHGSPTSFMRDKTANVKIHEQSPRRQRLAPDEAEALDFL
jgi:hypothetical protein